MKQLNLNTCRDTLTEQDIDALVILLTERCRAKTVNLIRSHLTNCINLIPHYGILERVMKDKHGWSYCAGQSYPDEIRTIRRIIIDLK